MTNRIWSVEDGCAAAVTVDKNSITMLANGGYVVAWREGKSKIALQVYNGLGQRLLLSNSWKVRQRSVSPK